MGLKAYFSKIYAKRIVKKAQFWKENPNLTQDKLLRELIQKAKNTAFGKDHNFSSIKNYDSFKKNVPISEYEGLKPYVERMKNGESDILWPGKPLYFAKTSGTTSGAKYIPISKESMPSHINATKIALLHYINDTGKTDFVNGKMIFLQGAPTLTKIGGVNTGRLSGIVAHHVPKYLQKNRLPSYNTNCIEDWETKLNAIVKETLPEKMTLISGIPSWVQMYFEYLIEQTDKQNIKEIFPDFSLFVYGGVNFDPYRNKFKELIGKHVDTIEVYPASEGFIAFQDARDKEGMLLYVDGGIFYEFIPADEFFDDKPTRIRLKDVEMGVNYVIILNTTAGLWGYNIGDTVKFVSKRPYRILVTGRIKHYISAFGEHVIGEEVESTMKAVLDEFNAEITEFTVAPQVNPQDGLPYHEWFVEFNKEPENLDEFSQLMDKIMQKKNIYYRDLLEGNILRPLVVTRLQPNAFQNYMKSIGKLGGQNKVPRLSNDRKIADVLDNYRV
jgi:hypothetical protein